MAKVLIIAGELSGDIFASGLIKYIKKIKPEAMYYAMGGENLKSEGAELIAGIDDLAVMGFTEVICKIKTIKRVLKNVSNWIRLNKPDVIILVDFPSFNFKIAKLSHKLKIPVVYFIPPKIWASRYKRINFIKKYIKFVIVIFPFELEIYKKAGIEAYYFGNPLYELEYKQEMQTKERSRNYPVISFLPGSRKTELKYHANRIVKSLQLIKSAYKDAFFIFPFRKGIDSSPVLHVLKKKNIPQDWYIITDSVNDALVLSDIIVAASGTASLEAGFYKKPVIIVYYLNFLTYLIAKVLVRIKYIGLINIMANKLVIPELIESKFTPQNVFMEIDKILRDDSYKNSITDEISNVISTLKTHVNPLEASANLIYDKTLKNV
ncbi:MAG: lipid-A-disaccharide synthase [Deltaproteobacteria bacterium]|nr:lipid-A-disaccharide synthase [Deltaproteobacteria bacterium]MCL5879420.1 lipid-A-disaccharide synthase [Deltaproteobacteria bacterium]MDA8304435.1 lipid-A-disaccharide synthase [Deltaproteobacteria bacterium]